MRARTKMLLVATVAGVLALAGPAQAAKTTMSLTLDGASSPVLAYSWGLSNSGSMHSGGGGRTGKANFQDMAITKVMDAMSPELVRSAATGRHHDRATLSVVNGPFTASYCLYEVLVTSVSHGGSSGNPTPTESLSLNFAEFAYGVGSSSFSWNIAESAASARTC